MCVQKWELYLRCTENMAVMVAKGGDKLRRYFEEVKAEFGRPDCPF